MSLYKRGIEAEVCYEPTMIEEASNGYAMVVRGLYRGEERKDLYKRGLTGERVGIDLVGGKDLFAHGPMETFTNLLVDIAHLLLMIGGIYLVAGAIWGGPRR